MPNKIKLSTAIEEYLDFRRANDIAESTLLNDRRTFRCLQEITGYPTVDLLVSSITANHVDKTLSKLRQTRPRAMHISFANLRGFFDWARWRKYYPRGEDPMFGRKPGVIEEREAPRVPRADFERLLDAAGTAGPRDRMIVALGLHMFLRQSEMKPIKLRHVNLTEGTIFITRRKVKKIDPTMPISDELDAELRTWLTYYSQQVGELKPDMYLLPNRTIGGMRQDQKTGRWLPRDGNYGKLYPYRQVQRPERPVQRALQLIGFPLRDGETGESLMTGEHTLRRSGARAFYEELRTRKDLPDPPKEIIRAMLGHKKMEQTEHYIGIDVHREARNFVVHSGPMFPKDRGNVVPIRAVGAE